MEKRDKEMPYEVIIQERNKVDLYGNVVYYIGDYTPFYIKDEK